MPAQAQDAALCSRSCCIPQQCTAQLYCRAWYNRVKGERQHNALKCSAVEYTTKLTFCSRAGFGTEHRPVFAVDTSLEAVHQKGHVAGHVVVVEPQRVPGVPVAAVQVARHSTQAVLGPIDGNAIGHETDQGRMLPFLALGKLDIPAEAPGTGIRGSRWQGDQEPGGTGSREKKK